MADEMRYLENREDALKHRLKHTYLQRIVLNVLDKVVKRKGLETHFDLFLDYFLKYKVDKIDICDIGGVDGRMIRYKNIKIQRRVVIDRDDYYRNIVEDAGIEFIKHELGKGRCKLKDASFDLILMNHVIEHVPDNFSALKEVTRLLKPNGIVLIRTPDIKQVQWYFFNDVTHIKPYTKNSLFMLSKMCGLQKIILKNFSYNRFMISFLFPKFLQPFLIFSGKEIIYIGKKARSV